MSRLRDSVLFLLHDSNSQFKDQDQDLSFYPSLSIPLFLSLSFSLSFLVSATVFLSQRMESHSQAHHKDTKSTNWTENYQHSSESNLLLSIIVHPVSIGSNVVRAIFLLLSFDKFFAREKDLRHDRLASSGADRNLSFSSRHVPSRILGSDLVDTC